MLTRVRDDSCGAESSSDLIGLCVPVLEVLYGRRGIVITVLTTGYGSFHWLLFIGSFSYVVPWIRMDGQAVKTEVLAIGN